jgi:hypothetical protein
LTRTISERINDFAAQCEQNILNDRPLLPPALMRGHIDKFKGVPGRYWNGEIITDLRQKIRKRPMSERKVQNLPPDLKSQQVMTLLATRVGGTVRRVDLSSVGNSCEVGLVDEADAVKFHFGLNETPFDNVIITCEAPTYDPLAED